MEQPYFLLFGLRFHYYGFFIALGGFLGYFIARKRLSTFKIDGDTFDVLILSVIPTAVVGARIYHILSSWTEYRYNLKAIFYLNRGGLGIYGAIFSVFIVLFFFNRLNKPKKISPIKFLDLISPSIFLMQAVGRIGNFFNQEVIGPPTNVYWKFYLPLEKRPIIFKNYSYFHPIFLYESLFSLFMFLMLIVLEKKLKTKSGFSFGFYLLTYGSLRYLLEFWRYDTWVSSGIKIGYFIALGFIVVGLKMVRNGLKENKLVK